MRYLNKYLLLKLICYNASTAITSMFLTGYIFPFYNTNLFELRSRLSFCILGDKSNKLKQGKVSDN